MIKYDQLSSLHIRIQEITTYLEIFIFVWEKWDSKSWADGTTEREVSSRSTMGFATASSATTANGFAGCAACAPLSLLSLHWEDPDRPTWPGTAQNLRESPRAWEWHENGMRMADDFWDSLTKLLEFFKVRPIEVRNSVTTNQLRHGQTPWHPWLSPANCSSSSPILPWNSVWLQNGCNLSLSYYVILIMIIIIQYDNHPIIPHLSGCSFSSMVYSCSDATRKQSKTVQNGPKRSLIKSALSPLLPAMAAASPQKLWSTGSKIWWLHGVFYQRWTYHRKLWTLF